MCRPKSPGYAQSDIKRRSLCKPPQQAASRASDPTPSVAISGSLLAGIGRH